MSDLSAKTKNSEKIHFTNRNHVGEHLIESWMWDETRIITHEKMTVKTVQIIWNMQIYFLFIRHNQIAMNALDRQKHWKIVLAYLLQVGNETKIWNNYRS